MAPKLVFDVANMQLALNDTAVNIYRFEGTPDMPWFQAKPVITFLDYSNITTTLDKVPEKNKSSLQELVETKGTPIGGVRDSLTPLLGYNDGKAIYINESGLYQLIFGSKKEEAIIFTDWVTEEVLPSIRKHGRYGNDDDDGEQPLAKRRRIAEDIADVMEERQVELRKKHEQGVLSLVGQIKESQTTAIAEFEKRQTTAIAEFEQRHKIALASPASAFRSLKNLSTSAMACGTAWRRCSSQQEPSWLPSARPRSCPQRRAVRIRSTSRQTSALQRSSSRFIASCSQRWSVILSKIPTAHLSVSYLPGRL